MIYAGYVREDDDRSSPSNFQCLHHRAMMNPDLSSRDVRAITLWITSPIAIAMLHVRMSSSDPVIGAQKHLKGFMYC